MKTADWKRVVRPLIPTDGDWAFHGSFCYRLPVHRLMLGVLAEGSAFDRGAFIRRVVMPLFPPTKHVNLSWSTRIGGGAHKYYLHDESEMQAAIKTAFSGFSTEHDEFARLVADYDPDSRNSRQHEVVGYAWIVLGDRERARRCLARACRPVEADAPDWVHGIKERARLVASLLDNEGPERALGQVDQWCGESAGALGLPKPARGGDD